MAKIFFNHVILEGFNVGTTNDASIFYPVTSNSESDSEEQEYYLDESSILDATQNSIIYGFKNTFTKNNENIAYYQSQVLQSDKFSIYRKNINDNSKTFLGIIDSVSYGVDDYNVAGNQSYQYTIETNPTDQTSKSISLQTKEFISTHWCKWTICDIEYDRKYNIYKPSDTIFSMINNLNIGAINNNLNVIKYDTLSKYNKIITNEQKYKSGSISCLIGDFEVKQILKNNEKIISVEAIDDPMNYLQQQVIRLNDLTKILQSMIETISENDIFENKTKEEYEKEIEQLREQLKIYQTYVLYFPQSNEYKYYVYNGVTWQPYNTLYTFNSPYDKIKMWEDFISNKKNKLLKAPNGDMWVVSICDTTQMDVNWNASSYPTTISFNWQEVLDVSKISILKW